MSDYGLLLLSLFFATLLSLAFHTANALRSRHRRGFIAGTVILVAFSTLYYIINTASGYGFGLLNVGAAVLYVLPYFFFASLISMLSKYIAANRLFKSSTGEALVVVSPPLALLALSLAAFTQLSNPDGGAIAAVLFFSLVFASPAVLCGLFYLVAHLSTTPIHKPSIRSEDIMSARSSDSTPHAHSGP